MASDPHRVYLMSSAAKVWPVYNYGYPRSIRADSIPCITMITPRCTWISAWCPNKCNCLKARATIDPLERRREHQAGRNKTLLLSSWNLMTGFTALADRIQFPDFSQVTVRSRSISGFSLRGSQPSVLHRNFVLYCFLDTVGSIWRAWCPLKNFSTNQQLKRWLHSWFILLQAFPRTGRGDGRGDSLSSILSVNLCSIR